MMLVNDTPTSVTSGKNTRPENNRDGDWALVHACIDGSYEEVDVDHTRRTIAIAFKISSKPKCVHAFSISSTRGL